MNLSTWSDLLMSLWDKEVDAAHQVLGTDLSEWLELVRSDYDEVDRLLIDHETIGGG